MMKNKLIILLLLLFAMNFTFGQKNTVELISSNDNETVLTFRLSSYDFKSVTTQNGEEFIVIADGLSSVLKKGFPDMPKFSESIIIPDMGSTKVEILSAEYKSIDNVLIAPSKGTLSRDIDPSAVPYEYGKIYSRDVFSPNELAELNKPYIARDFRGQSVHVFPFTYNPVQKELRVYSEITLKITTDKSAGENEFYRNKPLTSISKEFKKIYASHFINFESNSKYTSLEEEGNMLVICHDAWTTEMQAFVDWKNTIGRPCEMVTVTEVGGTSASAIQSYVENYYNTNGLTYLLLVGDAAQIPTNSGGVLAGPSDNAYAYISGNDHYQEFFVGRFSAENAGHVETQVLRTIEYETGDMLSDGWLNRCLSVGSDQGPGDDGEYDYQHLRNIQTDLFAFTYEEPPYECFDGSQGGQDAPGNPTPSDVAAAINAGVGIINYTGHGSETSWGSSGFSVTNINALTNSNNLPFIWSVACVNGSFVNYTCFGEAWLRAENGEEPAGAMAIMASTINQHWDEPMAGQDEMNDLLVGTSTNGIKRTFAGLSINGCFLMNEEFGSTGEEMTDTWTCFGDPSLLVRTDNTSEMTIAHNDVVIIGESTFDVSCDLDNALATLSRDGEIIGSAIVSGGNANVPVSGVTPGDVLTLAVTGFNKVTYLTELDVISPSGPYLVVETYVNEIDFGHTNNLDIVLKNVGQDDASDVSVTVTTSDPNATISNGTYNYGNIAAGSTSAASSGAFSLTVADDLEDQYQVAIDIVITDGSKALWEQTKYVTVNAPVFDIASALIEDDSDQYNFVSEPITGIDINEPYLYNVEVTYNFGNNNGLLDPGETVGVSVDVSNSGHASSLPSVLIMSTTDDTYVTIDDDRFDLSSISPDQSETAYFVLTVDENTPVGTVIELVFSLESGEYTAESNQSLPVGLQIEDFESGDFSLYNWTMGGAADWLISTNPHTGTYSAKSGDIDDYESSELSLTIDVAENGEISFWYLLSAEEDYDELHFYIDGSEVDQYNNETWTEVTEPITSGVHTLTWAYEKDVSLSYDDDCVYLDDITFPGHTAVGKNSRSLTLSATTLPDWLSLSDNGDGTAVLSGTSPGTPDLYDVVLEATDGSSSVTQEFTINVGNVAINAANEQISVYPNPCSDKLFVNLGNLDVENTMIGIYSLSGRKLTEMRPQGQNSMINLSEYSAGIYLLKITNEENEYISKVVLK